MDPVDPASSPANLSLLFGDWHGNGRFALGALGITDELAPDADLYHLGDFGLSTTEWGMNYLRDVDRRLAGLEKPLRIVPGNHENWDALRMGADLPFAFTDVDECGFMVSETLPWIRVSPRVNVWERGGLTFAALSGANSINYQRLRPGKNWWPQESPLPEHVDELVAAVGDSAVDVLLTHDAPQPAIDALDLFPAHLEHLSGWSETEREYSAQSRHVVEMARARLRPQMQFCGHHHVRESVSVQGTAVEILAADIGRSVVRNAALLVDGQLTNIHSYAAGR